MKWSIVTSIGLISLSIASIADTYQISKLQDQVAAIEIELAKVKAHNVVLTDSINTVLHRAITVQKETNVLLEQNNEMLESNTKKIKLIVDLFKP